MDGESPRPASPRLGRYLHLRRVAEGGMGEVWKGWDGDLGRWVAIKFLKGGDDDDRQRFVREARTAAGLSHPNIAAVFETGSHEGRPYLVMQFVPGSEIQELDAPLREKIRLVRDASLAVHHAHKQGIVHRDLKPSNLMVDPGPPARVFVMDFGLARRTSGRSSLSAAGIILGTPGFMSPEQALSDDTRLGPRSDVYSLGATLYALATGQPPFRHGNVMALLRMVVDTEPVPPRKAGARIDADLEQVILKCLEKDPGHRYPTARDLADDLDRWLAGDHVLASRPSAVRRLKVWVRRRPWRTAAAASLLLAAALAWPVWRKARDQERRADSAQEQLREALLYGPIERRLEVLRMKAYQTGYRCDDAELAEQRRLVDEIDEQMKRTGQSAAGWGLKGRCREAVMDRRGAEAAYRKALELAPSHATSLLALGRLLLEQSLIERSLTSAGALEEEAAVAAAERAADFVKRGRAAARSPEADLAADVAEAWLGLVRAGIQGRSFRSGPALEKWKGQPLVEEFLVVEGLADSSSGAADRAVAQMPSSASAWFWHGIVARNDERSAASLLRAVEIQPRWALARFQLGVIYQRLRRPEEALAQYDAAIAADPAGWMPRLNRAAILLDLNREADAEADLLPLLREHPSVPEIHLLTSQLQQYRLNYDAAERSLRQAIALRPGWEAPKAHLAVVFSQQGRWKEADQLAKELIARNTSQPDAWRAAGAVAMMEGRDEDAERCFTRAVELQPSSGDSRFNRGGVRFRMKKFVEALADAEAWLKENPDDRRGWELKTMIHGCLQQWQPCLEAAQRAIRAGSQDPEMHFAMGASQGNLGRLAEARQCYVEALRLAPQDWARRADVEKRVSEMPQ